MCLLYSSRLKKSEWVYCNSWGWKRGNGITVLLQTEEKREWVTCMSADWRQQRTRLLYSSRMKKRRNVFTADSQTVKKSKWVYGASADWIKQATTLMFFSRLKQRGKSVYCTSPNCRREWVNCILHFLKSDWVYRTFPLLKSRNTVGLEGWENQVDTAQIQLTLRGEGC